MFFKKEIEATLNTSSEMMPAEGLPQSKEISEVTQSAPAVPEKQNVKQAGNLVVGEGVCLRGSFNVPTKTTVTGLIEGSIATKELLVGQKGKVQGQVECQIADIAGHIESHLQAHDLLTLRSTAVILGDVFYKEIAIEKGAKITGKLTRL
jgi:cytoskeletal protein CcmA (bactofilin family)